jgi:endonuclease-3
MNRKERYQAFIEYFSEHQPDAETELYYENPYQLLVAVILSAQCTDKRVNMVTPALFKKYPDAYSLSLAETEDVFQLIRSISYPNNKAKHLVGMAQMLVKDFKNVVPSIVDELVKLPGVGRKTANVVLNTAFGEPTMAVDTHIFRVSNRTGLAPGKDVLKVEQQLLKRIPKEYLLDAHHWLILHGRYVCKARSPECAQCIVEPLCGYRQKTGKGQIRGAV